MFLTITLIIVILTIIVYQIKSFKNNSLSKIASDPGIPFFGHVFKLGKKNEDIVKVLEEMWIKYGRDKFIFKIGPFHQVVLTKPDDVAVVLLSKENVNKNIFYSAVKQMFGDSIITYPKEKWQMIRKIVSPAFNYSLLNYYVDILEDESTDLIKILLNSKNEEIDIYPLLYQSILRAVCRNVLGFEMKLTKTFEEFLESIDILLSLSTSRVFSSWKLINPIYNLTSEGKQFKLHVRKIRKIKKQILDAKCEELKDVIEKINTGKENVDSLLEDEEFIKQKISFVHLLLLGRHPNGEPLTIDEMINEMHVFVVGGFETTVAVTSFGLYSLAVNPEYQVKAFDEQLALTGGDLTKEITYREITEMKYLEHIIKETMRLYPPIPFIGRNLTEPVVLSDGLKLSAGTNIMLLPYLTHRNPQNFPNPDVFDPDRFIKGLNNQYSYFPFSLGPRNCVGRRLGMLQAKFYLAKIIRSFQLLAPLGDKPKLIMNPLLRSSTGINVRLLKRN